MLKNIEQEKMQYQQRIDFISAFTVLFFFLSFSLPHQRPLQEEDVVNIVEHIPEEQESSNKTTASVRTPATKPPPVSDKRPSAVSDEEFERLMKRLDELEVEEEKEEQLCLNDQSESVVESSTSDEVSESAFLKKRVSWKEELCDYIEHSPLKSEDDAETKTAASEAAAVFSSPPISILKNCTEQSPIDATANLIADVVETPPPPKGQMGKFYETVPRSQTFLSRPGLEPSMAELHFPVWLWNDLARAPLRTSSLFLQFPKENPDLGFQKPV
ncbi:unnamed protein product [Soboliphyme baturini]|uniref:Polo-like kinase 1 substrate 1 n=1 Tax=Soboliphyme baturini TaxID=241478 RepID=A0A183J072_9BILA|nr:unnamed protein product [Soboliphyme baturini]